MPPEITATAALAAVARGETTPLQVFDRYAAAILREEPRVHAFAHLDLDGARARVPAAAGLPLRGLPVAVKDVIDTAAMPTAYGSPIHAGHRPRADAAIVARLVAAGAVIVGKSVTTEFAYYFPGPTRNPHDPEHTPGGSSSGSAAAVAAGMVPFAIGTQTAGSMLRPASFCGVVGFKPSYGLLPTAGVHPLAPSFDTLGLFAATVADMALLFPLLARDPAAGEAGRDGGVDAEIAARRSPPRVAVLRGYHDEAMAPEAATALARAVDFLRAAGIAVDDLALAPALARLDAAQPTIMQVEMAAALAAERRDHADRLSPVLAEVTAKGAAVDAADHAAALALLAATRSEAASFFAGYDLFLTLAAPGPAPRGIAATGSPIFNRLWTALGTPALSLPAPVAGLPIGLQLIAPPGADRALLDHAATLAPLVGSPAAG